MMTNLLHAIKFPEKMNVIQTDIDDYNELNEIIRGIPKHLKSKKLFFFGDVDEIYKTLEENAYKAEISEPIRINVQLISEYWDILSVLFYRAIKSFLREKGFYLHKNLVYMVRHDEIEENPLIRKDNIDNYYIHEGFEYKLHLLDKKVFLSLTPRIVLTWDKRGSIISKEEGSGLYTSQGFNRWNSVIRSMLEVWIGFLSDANGITIPIPDENSLIFESKFLNASSAKGKRIEKKRQVSLNEYW
ncbi:MAG: hypothetical protein KAT65_17470 [Methanophagales archaeon]|nr:hypothetical protein [Methanophagales archaeon]